MLTILENNDLPWAIKHLVMLNEMFNYNWLVEDKWCFFCTWLWIIIRRFDVRYETCEQKTIILFLLDVLILIIIFYVSNVQPLFQKSMICHGLFCTWLWTIRSYLNHLNIKHFSKRQVMFVLYLVVNHNNKTWLEFQN
jgi:hypothetical protein